VDPIKSSFEVLYCEHDYNANPFVPLGCKVEMHVMPAKQKTFKAHTKRV